MTTINNLVAKHAAECAEQIIEAQAKPGDKRVYFMLIENAMFRLHADACNLEHEMKRDMMSRIQTQILKKR